MLFGGRLKFTDAKHEGKLQEKKIRLNETSLSRTELQSEPGARSPPVPGERGDCASTTRPRLRGPRQCAVLCPAAPADPGPGRRTYLASSPPARPGEPPPGGQRRARPGKAAPDNHLTRAPCPWPAPCYRRPPRLPKEPFGTPPGDRYLCHSSLPHSQSRAGSRQGCPAARGAHVPRWERIHPAPAGRRRPVPGKPWREGIEERRKSAPPPARTITGCSPEPP